MNITIVNWLNRSKSKDVKQRLRKTIHKELIPINRLSQNDKKLLINQAKILMYPMGSYIFKKGDRDNFIYYLLEGKVEMQAPHKKTIAVYGGTKRAMQPISGNYPREYSAKAASAVKVFQVNRQLLISMSPSKKRELNRSLSHT